MKTVNKKGAYKTHKPFIIAKLGYIIRLRVMLSEEPYGSH